MLAERKQWGILLSELVGGQLISRKYIGYSMTEAKRDFRTFLKGLKHGNAG
jgi:hypothetical protein